jgi:hypothetical protein
MVCSGKGAVIRKNYNMEDIKKCDIMKCQDCGLEYVSPMLTSEELDSVFKNYDDFRADFNALKKTSLRKINLLSKYGLTKESKLLDFGCGKNAFVETGESSNWLGYDKYAEFKQGMTRDFNIPNLDFITMWGVLAHLLNPKKTLNELTSCLKQGGILALTDIATDLPIPYQFRYEHVSYWNKESIETLFSETGLKMLECGHHRIIQNSDIYLRSVLRTVPETYKKRIYHILPEHIEVPTNELFAVGIKK